MEKSYHSKQGHSSSCIERQRLSKTKKPMLSTLREQMKDGIIEWRSLNNQTNSHFSSLSALGKTAYSILLMKWAKLYGITLCGLTHIRSKIKRLWNQFHLWIWRNKYGYFYCKHCCIACEYFDDCMSEFNGKAMEILDGPELDDDGFLWVSDTEAYKIVEGPIDIYEE